MRPKAIAAVWLSFAFAPSADPWLLAVPLLIWGFGGGIAGAPVMSVAMNVVDNRHAGMVGGTVTSLASLGGGIGTAVLGALYTARVAACVADAPAAQGPMRDALAEAAAAGDAQRVLELTPPAAWAGMQAALDRAIAAGGSAVLLASAALAIVTVAVVLWLINT